MINNMKHIDGSENRMILKLPFKKCFVQALEYWINQKAKEGWILTEIKGNRAWFEKHDQRITFRIDPRHGGFKKLDGNRGWKEVTPYDRFLSVYANDSKDPILSEVEKESAEYEVLRLVKQREETNWFLRGCWIPVLCIMLLSAMAVFYAGQEELAALRDAIPVGVAVLLLLFVGFGFLLGRNLHAIGSWVRYRCEKQTDDFYGKIKRRAGNPWPSTDKIRKGVLWGALGLILLEAVVLLGESLMHRTGLLEEYQGTYVTLEEIEGKELTPVMVDGFNNYYETDWSVRVPLQRSIYQGAYLGEEERAMRISEYHLRGDKLSSEFVKAKMKQELGWNSYLRDYAKPIEIEGADEAYYAGYMSMQYLFIRQGEEVTCVFYLGGGKLEEKASLFIKK